MLHQVGSLLLHYYICTHVCLLYIFLSFFFFCSVNYYSYIYKMVESILSCSLYLCRNWLLRLQNLIRTELHLRLNWKRCFWLLFRSTISGSVLRGAYVLHKCVYLFSIIFLYELNETAVVPYYALGMVSSDAITAFVPFTSVRFITTA